MHVVAVVVNWNGADDLPGCLDALRAQDHRDLEVLVVDNASTDRSREVLEGAGVRVVWNPVNRGYAGAVNDARAATDAPALLVCNPDVRPRPDHVRHLVAAMTRDPRVGAVQGKLLRRPGAEGGAAVIDTTGHVAFRTRLFRNRGEGEPDDGRYADAGEVFGVSGALALYRREMLDDVGGLDEDLFAFFEDVDLDWRARTRGWVARYEPAAVAEHERGGAGPRRTRQVEALNFRNRLLVVAKDDDPRRLLVAAPSVALTTLLKAGELALTDPVALGEALAGLARLLPRAVARRAEVHGAATVPSAAVVDAWFERFDYRRWVATWWRRVTTGRARGSRPARSRSSRWPGRWRASRRRRSAPGSPERRR